MSSEWYRLPFERGRAEAFRIYLRRLQILFLGVGIALIAYGALWLFAAPNPWPWLLVAAGGAALSVRALPKLRALSIARRASSIARREELPDHAQSRLRVALEVADAGMRRSLLRQLGSTAVGFVGESAGLRDIRHLIAATSPNVLLVDVKLPNQLAREELRALMSEHPGVNVIFLTAENSLSVAADVVHAGARGYLLREHAGAELLDTLQRVASGRTVIDPHIVVSLAQELLGVAERGSEREAVTSREVEILRLLAVGDTARDIAEQLYISQERVQAHVQHIFQKLRMSDRGAAMAEALSTSLANPSIGGGL